MRVLSIDSGAKRAGWAILETGPKYLRSGVIHFPRGDNVGFQAYRLDLARFWVQETQELLDWWRPDHVVTETVPSRGFNIPEQGYLANVQATTLHAIAIQRDIPVSQVMARTVQSEIAVRGRSKKITKQQVRNGVISLLPELKSRVSDWVKVFEEPDALAIGLWYLDHSNK